MDFFISQPKQKTHETNVNNTTQQEEKKQKTREERQTQVMRMDGMNERI